VDIVAGPTNDVVVADTPGATTFEQHRWSSAGALVNTHQDSSGSYTGKLWTSNLFADASNGVFYGMLLTGLVQGQNSQMSLIWNHLAADGTVKNFSMPPFTGTLPTSSGPPSVSFFQVGGDSGANLHGTFVMANPQILQEGVYCYDYMGNYEGASAQNITTTLTPQDFLWPTPDNGLILFQPLTATTNLGCATPLTVPAAGGVALAKFTGGGSCTWNKLLALPTAAIKSANFQAGADGSLDAIVAYSGTINFGGGPLQSTGTSSLAIARFDTSGNLLWAKSFGGAGSSFKVGSLGVNATGTMIVTGHYTGTVDLGGGPLPASGDTFLAVFNSAGALQWSKTVTVGAQGELLAAAGKCGLVLATNSPTVNLGTGPLSTSAPPLAATIGVAALGL
jgi:hypothetical protein